MDLRQLERAAREQGWRIEVTKKGHPRWIPPDPTREIVIGSGTPGDYRQMRNFVGQLRRSGFIWPWPPKEKSNDGVDRGVGGRR